jgi:hypothetical protein
MKGFPRRVHLPEPMLADPSELFNRAGNQGGQEEMTARGLNTQQHVKERLKTLGRSGRLPWAEDDVTRALSYLASKDLVVLPTAHALLRGVLKSLLVLVAPR